MLTHGSLFSGVGGFDLGFDAAGFETLWQCEIDKQARSVLGRHWATAIRYEDVTAMDGASVSPVDVISFGSPCQDLSKAGKRAGIKKGTRSGLFTEAVRVIREMRNATNGEYPQIAVWENVRGALSSNGGRDFAKAVRELRKAGALDIAWRLVSTSDFGPPQRRERIFVIADFRAERAGEILAHPTRVCWNPTTYAGTEPAAAGSAGDCSTNGRWTGRDGIVASLTANDDAGADFKYAHAGHLAYTKGRRAANIDDFETWNEGGLAPTLNVFDNTSSTRATIVVVENDVKVRRLTPRECERLQGWPDDHTRWTDTGKELADSPRYRMIGNGVSAPVAQWLAENIAGALSTQNALV